jgi:tetratricopeptide (TPR) repeat protein
MNGMHAASDKQQPVWSPRALVWFALLFSVFPAAIMFALNYGRYGQPRKRLLWLAITTGVLVVFCSLDYLDPNRTKLRIIGLTVLTAWILYVNQIALFREWRTQGGRVASVWSGLGICVAFVAAYLAATIALSFLEPDYLASDLIDKGDFYKAEEVLNQSRRAYPTDLDVRYNLAIVYSETERKDAALRELRAVLARKPRDQQAKALLEKLTDDAGTTNNTEQTVERDSETRPTEGPAPGVPQP